MALFFGHIDLHPLDNGGYFVVRVRDANSFDEPLAAPMEIVAQFQCACDNAHDWLYHGLCELVDVMENSPAVLTFDAPEGP